MNVLDLNLEFCCTCLKVGTVGDKFVNLSFTPPEEISYKNKLKSCVPEMGLENTDDCFLCKPCTAALETAYTFRCMCLRTETRLEEFRMSQNKNSGLADKSIKQELIESSVVEEDSIKSREAYSTGSIEIIPTDSCTASVSTQPETFFNQPKAAYPTPTTSKESEEVYSPEFSTGPEDKSVDIDSKIEIVKDELGSLLTESIGSAIDINIHIFDEQTQRSRKINSKVDIFNSLNAEIKEMENNSYNQFALIPNKRLTEESKQFNLPSLVKEDKQGLKDFKRPLAVPLPERKRLSDSEIIKICCKTNPDLHNCLPESLDCQVTLEKIEVFELPVKVPTLKKTTSPKSKGKPYWCSVCHKDVYRKERYHAHILRHSNIRAYKCNICKQGFFSSETLTKHKKGCVALSQDVNLVSESSKGNVNMPVASNITHFTTTKPTTSQKFSKKKMVRKTTSRVKVRKIPSTSRIRKKVPMKNEVIQSIHIADRPIKTEPGVVTNVSSSTNNIRKSTRQHTPSKKLCNMNDAVFRCKQCSYQSYYKQKFHVHLLHHTNDKPFPCLECSKRFYEKWELNRHVRINHSQNKTNSSFKGVKKPTKMLSQNNTMTAKNSNYNWEPNSLSALLEPAVSLIVNPGTVVTPIIQSIHSLAETSTENDSIEMSFSCKVCKISFRSRNLLMLHTQTHELKRTCEVCQEQFITEVDFLEHARIHNVAMDTDESIQLELPPKIQKKKKRKKFFCNICDMEFASRDHANIHTGAKPYTCKVCFKQFAAYTTLRKHNLTHQDRGEPTNSPKKGKRQVGPQRQTYNCEICQKKFVKKEHVYSHNCHNASGDSVYRCQICKNAFIGRAALIEHMGIHVSENANAFE